jgi:TolB-like protein/Tfp pilus assembly protein PilF
MEMLQNDLGTVAEIAYMVGFGSPTYFIKSFHDYFGCPPGEYKKYADKTTGNESDNKELKSEKGTFKKYRLAIFVGLMVIVATFVFYNQFIKPEPEKSILVLPLKTHSNDLKIQSLATGLMEDILIRLSHIKYLEVKSRITSEKISETRMSALDIYREYGVSYILEGSIIPDKDSISVKLQLISAKEDRHDWAKSFDENLAGLHSFITTVSKQIVEELQLILTEGEILQIEKQHTDNPEAYNLYQRGKYFFHRRTEEDLYNSIKYFNQALEIDSTYALAYAGLATVYNELTRKSFYPRDEGYAETMRNAKKAVSLDYSVDEAHVALGHIAGWCKWDWQTMEKELNIALKLNPNSAFAHNYLSVYYRRMGNNIKARYYKNKALELHPFDSQWFISSADLYLREEKFDEAIKENQKALELNNREKWAHFISFKAHYHLGSYDKAIEELKKFYKLDAPGKGFSAQIDKVYHESGIKGVLSWSINEADNSYYQLARWYCYLGNRDSALFYLEKEYKSDFPLNLPKIKNNPDFKILNDEPRFNALLKKMNLPVD